MSLLKLASDLDEMNEVEQPRELSLIEERYLKRNNPTISNAEVGVGTAALSAPIGVAAYLHGNNSHLNKAVSENSPQALTKKNLKAAHLKGLRQAAGWGGGALLVNGATTLGAKRWLQKEHDAEKNLLQIFRT